MPPEHIAMVGVRFPDVGWAIRTQLALGPDRAAAVREHIVRSHPDLEAVVIATCNRTQLMLAGDTALEPTRAIAVFHAALGDGIGAAIGAGSTGRPAPCLGPDTHPTVEIGDRAVRRLFEVASGLDSAILGDNEILGQLRKAWHDADAAGHAGPRLRRVFRDAFSVGRQVRSRTDIGAGGAGVGSAVAAAVGGLTGPVLVIGAGPAGRTIARRLAKQAASIIVANRTFSAAHAIATEVGGTAVRLSDVANVLAMAGVVVSAVSSPEPVLTAHQLDRVRDEHPGWNPLIVDVGAPPNVEPHVGFRIVDLDDLAVRSDAVADRRYAAVSAVESIIDTALQRRAGRVPTPPARLDTPARFADPDDAATLHQPPARPHPAGNPARSRTTCAS